MEEGARGEVSTTSGSSPRGGSVPGGKETSPLPSSSSQGERGKQRSKLDRSQSPPDISLVVKISIPFLINLVSQNLPSCGDPEYIC